MIWFWIVCWTLIAFGAGVGLGFRLGERATRADVEDRLERIEDTPSSRTPGQPTNTGVPFSRVSQGRMRRRMMTGGDAHDE